MDFGDLPSEPLRKRKSQARSNQETTDYDTTGKEVVLGTRSRLMKHFPAQTFTGTNAFDDERMFQAASRFLPVPDDRVAPVLDVKIGIHVSGEGQRTSRSRPMWMGLSCRKICWSIFVLTLALLGFFWILFGQMLSNISPDRSLDAEEAPVVAKGIAPPITSTVRPEHSALFESLLQQKQHRMKQSIDLALTFADQARDLGSQQVLADDPGFRRTIESLPQRSDSFFATLDDRFKALSHELQEVVDVLDYVKLTIADATSRVERIEKELPSRKISLVGRWLWRKTQAYGKVRTHIDAVLVLGSVTTPLVQSFEGKVATITGAIDAFRGDVKRVCSRYEDSDAYITLQARLLNYKVGTGHTQSTSVHLNPQVSAPVLPAGQVQGTCPRPNANSNAIMSAGDSMAAMSAFCGEMSHGLAQVLALDGDLEGRSDVMDDSELVKVLGRRVDVAVREHEDLLRRASRINELV